jgi:hypothetical protein
MIEPLGGIAIATLAAIGGLTPASAGAMRDGTAVPNGVRFSAGYVCTVPILGPRTVLVNAELTAIPDHAVARRPVRFRLHITGLGLRSPISIASWRATATIEVSGAQTTSFQLTGAGGTVAPRQPVTGTLTGDWTPRAAGTDQLRGGPVTITAAVPPLGDATIPCTPTPPRPTAGTLTVTPDHPKYPHH